MKKFITLGVLALALAALSTQQASAWVNLKAGIGANLGFQSGGNNLLWGAFRNGQPPGPDCGTCPGGFPGGVYPGGPMGPGPGAVPFHGHVAPSADQQGLAGDAAATPAGRTQSYNNYFRTNGQTVNYQYPYYYNYYYGYGR